MTRPGWDWIALGIAAAALTAVASVSGAIAARGWLCAFVLMSMVPLGSLALLLAHGISGGRWGADLAPILVPGARCLPLLFVAFLPILIFRPLIYQWRDLDVPVDVARYYLNPTFFDARTFVALSIWSALAWSGAWRTPLFSALGLTVHLILMTFIPSDWILTLPPGSTSAGFGMGFGIEQMGAALGFAAVLAPGQQDRRANRDLAGLLVTILLGTTYFVYMQFIVTWYGNVPSKVRWYVQRSDTGWSLLALAAFAIGAALPFAAILNPVVRREASALRFVGGGVLVGITLHIVWLTAPAFGARVLIGAAPAVLLLAMFFAAVSRTQAGGSHGH